MASSSLSATKMTNPIRGLVSKRRIRYTQDGFDLDLTYINDRIIAMGYPAEHMESIYRNKIEDVQRMLERNHAGCYKIYNLCSERSYDHKRFPYYSVYPFKDHNPPDIELITSFCRDVDEHLRANGKNVVAVHCKAGKGRTGTMICCYLLYSRQFQTADEALHYYAQRRTSDAKGVTIPSQRRYVEYYATLLRSNETYQPVQLYICEIRLTGTVNIREGTINVSGETPKPLPEFRRTDDTGGGGGGLVGGGQSPPYTMLAKMDYCMPLSGDVKIEFVKSSVLRKEKRCHFWFNTYFVERAAKKDAEGNLLLPLSKTEIDDAHKDKHHKEYPNNFSVELVLRRVPNGSKYSESVSLKKCHPPPMHQQQHHQQQHPLHPVGLAMTNNSSPLIRSSLENNRQVPPPHHQQPPPLSYQQHIAQQQQQQQQYQQSIHRSQVGGDPYRAAMIKQQNSYNEGGYLGQQPLQNNHNQQQQQLQHHLEYSGTSSSESSTEEEGWDSGECPTQLLESPAKAANLLYYRNDNYYYGSCSSSSPTSSGPSSSASHPNPTATTTTTAISTVSCNSSSSSVSKIREPSVAESASNSSSSGKLSHNTVSSSNLNQPLANTTTISSSSSSSSRSSVKPAVVVPEPFKPPRASNGKLPVEPLTAVACPSTSSANANASAWPSIGLRRKKKKSFKSTSARNFALATSASVASASTKSGKGRFRSFRWLKNMRGDPNLKKVLATSGDIVTLTNAGRPVEEPDPAIPSTPPPSPTINALIVNATERFLSSSGENLLSLDYYSSICDKQLSFESPCKSPGHLMKLNLSRRPPAPPPSEPDCPVVVAKPSEQRLKIGFEVTPSPSPTSPQSDNPFVVVTTSDPDPQLLNPLPPTTTSKAHNLVPRSENASFCDRILQTFVAGISPRKSSGEHDLQLPPPPTSSSSTHNSPLVARAVSRCSSFSLRELGQELRSVIKAQPAAAAKPPASNQEEPPKKE
ncbi:serine-rich adhesin for platelets isoform X1 [Culex pipiens pallens]|uniref:serine-rich adhesin for platelets isoform X1 n=1 Tax=Culex pipiens pallens TaxID=42434 RepID=UPI0019539A10|nr:serine-rich adhesin for platelets isoform X1 [Culex pipiens pallens]XP_039429756.1 serine-rich adhesin for platelets isoform X1 [Culex pipiens pallens]XP_052564825.1 serine-rich adhesin for platelets isoform X1 [Culex pipiens pallens]XP_052564826.1 serine-rich adhesin for platelets isoform X1 [Culex pipiens pallens]